ncbi:MAG: acetyl-CoA carboxylase biotin carboxyl carrier protein subunit [Oligoflexales bacterium]
MKWEVQTPGQPSIEILLPQGVLPNRKINAIISGSNYWLEWSPELHRILLSKDEQGPHEVLHYRRLTSDKKRDYTSITLEAENHIYHLKVQRPLPPGTQRKKAKTAEIVRSPMTGKVLKVCCEAGDSILEGDTIAIIEAMKMENRISSPANGIVKSISTATNDNISTGHEIAVITTT